MLVNTNQIFNMVVRIQLTGYWPLNLTYLVGSTVLGVNQTANELSQQQTKNNKK